METRAVRMSLSVWALAVVLFLWLPLVLICVDHKSQSYPALREAGRFGINFLHCEHEPISRRFASTRLDKFDGVAYRRLSAAKGADDTVAAAK